MSDLDDGSINETRQVIRPRARDIDLDKEKVAKKLIKKIQIR